MNGWVIYGWWLSMLMANGDCWWQMSGGSMLTVAYQGWLTRLVFESELIISIITWCCFLNLAYQGWFNHEFELIGMVLDVGFCQNRVPNDPPWSTNKWSIGKPMVWGSYLGTYSSCVSVPSQGWIPRVLWNRRTYECDATSITIGSWTTKLVRVVYV